MTDMEQTFIRSAITEFVNEADLLSALRPIQARKVLAAWKLRCQTPESSSSSVGGSPGPSASLMSYSPRSSSSTSSDSCKRPDIDWMDSFVIPWDKFPEELMQTLERGKRPSPQMRREMSKRLLQALTKFKVMRGELSGCSEDVKDMVLLLLSYFDEKEDTMFCYVEDTCLAGEVQMDKFS
ncbi:50S ribosomal protein L5 [Dissostichus eleginoides]|uniref:50S ribosomal protein L5 n=1 Tax=Dissostichus eleginoides TaxID=100907 RepID=A0AAD9FCZ2_DISEL|nr:50S ribosomal protein L5 [Dissostichus eleginoides]